MVLPSRRHLVILFLRITFKETPFTKVFTGKHAFRFVGEIPTDDGSWMISKRELFRPQVLKSLHFLIRIESGEFENRGLSKVSERGLSISRLANFTGVKVPITVSGVEGVSDVVEEEDQVDTVDECEGTRCGCVVLNFRPCGSGAFLGFSK
jgi:hypothetical protein